MPYALRLLECLLRAGEQVHLLVSPAARTVIAMETELQLPTDNGALAAYFQDYFSLDNLICL